MAPLVVQSFLRYDGTSLPPDSGVPTKIFESGRTVRPSIRKRHLPSSPGAARLRRLPKFFAPRTSCLSESLSEFSSKRKICKRLSEDVKAEWGTACGAETVREAIRPLLGRPRTISVGDGRFDAAGFDLVQTSGVGRSNGVQKN